MKKENDCVLWIDPIHRIIAFQKTEGFEPKVFSSHEEKISYAFQKSSIGYRIQ